jgi:hypothetical protein
LTTDQRVVAKQEIQEVESAKRAGAPYAYQRYQARDANTKLRKASCLGACLRVLNSNVYNRRMLKYLSMEFYFKMCIRRS